MNKKKRRLAVVLATVTGSAVLVLSGCSGKSEQTEKTLRVGVITYSQDDPFINGLTDELKVQLKAMENKQRRIIVSTKSGNDDQQEQNEKVEEMIDAGCDVLCINLVDRTAPSRIVRMARRSDAVGKAVLCGLRCRTVRDYAGGDRSRIHQQPSGSR